MDLLLLVLVAEVATSAGNSSWRRHSGRDVLEPECCVNFFATNAGRRIVSFQFVELEVDPNEIKQRLKARDERTDEMSDARLEDFDKLSAAYESPSELGSDLIRVSTIASVSDAVKTILLCLAENSARLTDSLGSEESSAVGGEF